MALLEVLNDIYTAGDDQCFTVVISLDILAAFDMLEHSILLNHLRTEFELSSNALQWVSSYLSNRQQYVKLGGHSSGRLTVASVYPRGLFWDCCYLPHMLRQWEWSSRVSECNTSNTQTTHRAVFVYENQ